MGYDGRKSSIKMSSKIEFGDEKMKTIVYKDAI